MSIPKRQAGFSLVELVIVIVIIGVIAAIAVPRISRGAKGAVDSAMRYDLAILRNAVTVYNGEHGGNWPTVAKFKEQMTTFTDDSGADNATKDATHIYGPYVKAVPPLPVAGVGTTGGKKGDTGVAAADGVGIGWIYNENTGEIKPNTGTAKDDTDTLYTDY